MSQNTTKPKATGELARQQPPRDVADETELIAVIDRLITCIEEAQQAITDLQGGN